MHVQLEEMGEAYVLKYQVGDGSDIGMFRKAVLAQDLKKLESVAGLNEADIDILHKELASRWSQPRLSYLVIVLCPTCATRSLARWLLLSETVISKALACALSFFGIETKTEHNTLLLGLPYACAAPLLTVHCT